MIAAGGSSRRARREADCPRRASRLLSGARRWCVFTPGLTSMAFPKLARIGASCGLGRFDTADPANDRFLPQTGDAGSEKGHHLRPEPSRHGACSGTPPRFLVRGLTGANAKMLNKPFSSSTSHHAAAIPSFQRPRAHGRDLVLSGRAFNFTLTSENLMRPSGTRSRIRH